MTYQIFDPCVHGPLHQLERGRAAEAFDWFMLNIPVRLSELSKLVAVDGVVLDYSEDSVAKLHDWFFDVANEERQAGNVSPSPELFSVCNDIGVYVSEYVIRTTRSAVTWQFYTADKKGLSYQRPVLAGFGVPNKSYCVDVDYLLCTYAFRILKTGKKDEGLVEAIAAKAVSIA